MPRTRRRRRRNATAIALVGTLVCLLAPPTGADLWYESYEKAEQAIQVEDWAEAVRQINLALEKRGDSAARVRTYGMNFIEYFPYYKLGLAYYQLGRYDAALQAFETEEAKGAIVESDEAFGALQRLRGELEQVRAAAASEERQRIDKIVADGLTRARSFEEEDRLDDALAAVDEALAVAPDHPDATTARQRLLADLARRQQASDRQARIARLLDRGRTELVAERFEQAAALFKQALEIEDSPGTQTLFDQAQSGLRARFETEQDEQRRAASIVEALSQARAANSSGDVATALTRLQTVLALDPANADALVLQTELIGRQAAAEQLSQRDAQITELLAEASAHMEENDYTKALTASNRILALDPRNEIATGYITQAYGKLSRRLLGRNLPPILSFFPPDPESVTTLEDGRSVELVSSPDLLLAGNVLDEGEVDLEFFVGDAPIGRGTTRVRTLPQGIFSTDFTLRHRLSPGLSFRRSQLTTIVAVATDEENTTEKQQYDVLYRVPLYRLAWLYLGLGLGAVAGAGVFLGRRRQVRNRRLERRFNPYVAGAPVLHDDRFFGRERLLDRVLQTVHNNSILLYGERRIGKTSFQHRLKRRLEEVRDPRYRFYPVYIDLQGTPQEKFFSQVAEDIFHELAPHLDGCKPNPSITGPSYQYRELVRDLNEVIKTLKQNNDKEVKVVLLIDEVDELNAYDPRINQRLRSLFMRNFSENLAAVVSGVSIKKHWESEGSPWYNFFEEIPVNPFRREDAVALIEKPIRGVFDIEPGVSDRIIELTECRPYLIQKLCIAIVNRLHEEGRRRITTADVDAVGRPEVP